jgi:hypothetical protein
MIPAPPGLARHFADGAVDLDSPAGRSAAIGRLLEDGDRADLAWLGRRVPRGEIAAWYRAHAGRRLSRRSRAFWGVVLGEPQPAPPALAEALWPLA